MRENARLLALLALFLVAGIMLWRVLRTEQPIDEPPPVTAPLAEAEDGSDTVVAEPSENLRTTQVDDISHTPALEAAPGRIAGWTVSPEGAPIARAEVLIHHPEQKARRLLSDAQGAFIADDLNAETYTVRANADHFNPAVHERIAPGSEPVLIEMSHRSALEGRVRDARTGEYLTQFELRYMPDPPGDEKHWRNIVADENSQWQLVDLPSGQYRVEDVYSDKEIAVGARAEGFEAAYVTVASIAPGATAKAPDILLLPDTLVAGTVTGPDGAPVAGADVSVVDGNVSTSGETDGEGAFEIGGLGDGTVEVIARYEGLLATSVEVELIRGGVVPVQLQLQRGGSVAGVITLDGAPVQGATVKASTIRGSNDRADSNVTATSDSSGRYLMTGLAPGAWNIFAQLGEEYDSPGNELGASITVGDGDVEQDFAFTSDLGALEGSISVNNVPAAQATIEVRPAENWLLRINTGQFQDGAYRVDDIIPGLVRVHVEAQDAAGQVANASVELEIAPGELVRYDFHLETATVLVGRIVNATPEQTQVAILTGTRAQPPSLSYDDALRLRGQILKEVNVAQDGTFEVTGLTPGDYTIFAVTTGGDPETYFDNLRIRFVPFTVPAAEGQELLIRFE